MNRLLFLAVALPLLATYSCQEYCSQPGCPHHDATVHYVCAGGEHEEDAPLSAGVPECCGAPMTPKP